MPQIPRPEATATTRLPGKPSIGVALLILTVVLSACYGVAPPPQPAMAEMHVHFRAIAEARRAAIFGDHAALQSAVQAVRRRGAVVGIPAGQAAMLFDLRQRARVIEESQRLEEAIGLLPLLLTDCGGCHEASGIDLASRFVLREPPERAVLRDPHSQSLSWAVNRMWEGLLAPSQAAWSSGAHVLADAPHWRSDLTAVGDPGAVARARAQLVRLGSRAAAAGPGEPRAEVLGKVLETCADCHARSEAIDWRPSLSGNPDHRRQR